MSLLKRFCRYYLTFIKEGLPLLPNPCHCQGYERTMFSPDQPGSEGCPPKICADEVSGEDEGEVFYVKSTMQTYHFGGNRIGEPIQFSGTEIWTPSTDLSFPDKRRNRILVTPMQFKSSPSGYRFRCLLHQAACGSTVTYCRGTGAMGTSLIRVHLHLVGPYRRPMPKVLGVL